METPSWLNSDIVKPRLINASLFLLGYELLKSSIVDGVKGFYSHTYEDDEWKPDSDYQTDVLDKAKHVFQASLLWLHSCDAITEDEVKDIQSIREYRNQIAHDIPMLIFDDSKEFDLKMIEKTQHYVHKIDSFWGRVEVDTNPEYDNQEIDYEGITSLKSIALNHIAEAVQDTSTPEKAPTQ